MKSLRINNKYAYILDAIAGSMSCHKGCGFYGIQA